MVLCNIIFHCIKSYLFSVVVNCILLGFIVLFNEGIPPTDEKEDEEGEGEEGSVVKKVSREHIYSVVGKAGCNIREVGLIIVAFIATMLLL